MFAAESCPRQAWAWHRATPQRVITVAGRSAARLGGRRNPRRPCATRPPGRPRWRRRALRRRSRSQRTPNAGTGAGSLVRRSGRERRASAATASNTSIASPQPGREMISATIVMRTISTIRRWVHSQKTKGLISGTSRPKASGQSGIDLLAPVSRTILPRTTTKKLPTAAIVESALTARMDFRTGGQRRRLCLSLTPVVVGSVGTPCVLC